MSLPEPRFIETDQQAVLEACIREYEEICGRTLYPAQSERLLINLIAYREHLLRVGIQEAAKQNLVRYARAPMLDLLGELVGVTRLPAAQAACAVRFSLEAPLSEDLPIAADTIIYSRDGGHKFLTREACLIPAGEIHADAVAVAAEAGAVELYPLTADGLPGEALLALVEAYVGGEKIRPLTDTVRALAPQAVPAVVRAELTLYAWADENSVRDGVNVALDAWLTERRGLLGLDIVRSQLVALLSVYGVYRVELLEPAADVRLGPSQWADWQIEEIILTAEREDG